MIREAMSPPRPRVSSSGCGERMTALEHGLTSRGVRARRIVASSQSDSGVPSPTMSRMLWPLDERATMTAHAS